MIKNVKIGQVIKIIESPDDKYSRRTKVSKVFKVIAIYPFHVLTVNKLGIRRSFSYGDLIEMGLEIQSPELEAKKKTVDWTLNTARPLGCY